MDLEQIGNLLRQRREELGLDMHDAQKATKIRLRYLEALERGDDSIMPGYVYTRGFLRSYALYLDLDASQILDAYAHWKETAPPPPTNDLDRIRRRTSPGESPPGRRRGRVRIRRRRSSDDIRLPKPLPGTGGMGRRIGAIVLLILLVAGAYMGISKLYTAARDGLPTFLDRWVGSSPEPPSENGLPGDDNGDPNAEPEEPPEKPEPEPEPEPPAPAVTRTDTGSGPVVYEVSDSHLAITLDVTGRCWLRIEVDGELAFEGTLEPGDKAEYTGLETIWMRAGNPAGINLTVNGEDMGVPTPTGPRNLEFRLAPLEDPP